MANAAFTEKPAAKLINNHENGFHSGIRPFSKITTSLANTALDVHLMQQYAMHDKLQTHRSITTALYKISRTVHVNTLCWKIDTVQQQRQDTIAHSEQIINQLQVNVSIIQHNCVDNMTITKQAR